MACERAASPPESPLRVKLTDEALRDLKQGTDAPPKTSEQTKSNQASLNKQS